MIEILIPIVTEVAQYQKLAFTDRNIVFETKADKFDFVSEVDRRSQQMILTAIEQHFPASGIVAEEEGEDKLSQDGTWFLVDPLDGTANFKAGIPLWAISIGFVRDGVVEEGIISLPYTEETFFSKDVVPLVQPLEKLAAAQFYGIDSTFENLQFQGLILKRRQLGAAVPTLLWCCDSQNREGLTPPSKGGRGSLGEEAVAESDSATSDLRAESHSAHDPSACMPSQRPRLDFALMGKGSFWDVCGAIAFLKQKGGSLIDATGVDFTECSDLFQVLGGIENLRTYNFRYVASASKQVAQEVYQLYLQTS
ncbi:Inositol-1-monophosphatase [Hyella patelloides LEGE 07179]|uniref:Inositol-1-monophosphatase n=1 Tax=Hyella patelloides LEGE 07179 TaxID=945734 RepID=A0A563VR94_9CYAN|nr:inositol monophosphatase family protein [Hyella patelloides]VEP13986.1 Inositol-1-monophosphatase [Hyella patelloides LEGE 07179]